MAAGRLLRVSSFNYAPYHVITEQGFNAPVKGVCGEILIAIAQSLNTNYTITFPLDSFWGLLKPDGNWTGVLGMMQRDVSDDRKRKGLLRLPTVSLANFTAASFSTNELKEADLALSVINPTSEKKDVAVESETILPIEIMILAGRQSLHESNILGIIQIFPWEVWLLALCGLVTSAFLWSVSDYVHMKLRDETHSFSPSATFFGRIWAFVESSFQEASPEVPSRASARVLVGAYWVVVIILTTTFAGQMKAVLMVREEADRIDSLRDLSQRPHMKPYLPAGSAVVSSIRDSKDPYYQMVWRMIQKYKTDLPPAVVLSDGSMLEVIRGKAVVILSRPTLAARATEVCANSTEGEFYVGQVPTFKFNSVFYFNKRMPAPLRDAINKRS
ncbi:hypothetical protein V5799_032260 [Amblyomma americanum]|uniref:Ionotropic glutamate receptor L-glutamate and glycine-binding domain-containing protein n=1 Tax=Amblyomma americanum TaxID=6943 RepID=A0AAQ4DRN9_AMBAM